MSAVSALKLVDQPEQAAALLDPVRLRIVRELESPDSATGLARKMDLPRQRVNYHLRSLEKAGLVRLVATRRRRNCTERLLQATARAYLISPGLLRKGDADPSQVGDKTSAAYLMALAARTVDDVGLLRRHAGAADQRLATLGIDVDVRLASPRAFKRFAAALAQAISEVAQEFHDESSEEGRTFRVMAGTYPAITRPELRATDNDAGGEPERSGEEDD